LSPKLHTGSFPPANSSAAKDRQTIQRHIGGLDIAYLGGVLRHLGSLGQHRVTVTSPGAFQLVRQSPEMFKVVIGSGLSHFLDASGQDFDELVYEFDQVFIVIV